MGNFSLHKLKDSFSRRLSEPLPLQLAPSKSAERRNSTTVFGPDARLSVVMGRLDSYEKHQRSRSRSRSVSKKEMRHLVRQETSQVIVKKLLHILEESGAQPPITLDTSENIFALSLSKQIRVHIANSNECVYLPSAKTKNTTVDDLEADSESNHEDDLNGNYSESQRDSESPQPVPGLLDRPALGQILQSATSVNYLNTKVDSDLPIPHLFAVIAEVGPEKVYLNNFKVTLLSVVKTEWADYESGTVFLHKDSFKIASHTWNLKWKDADYFISNVNSNERCDMETSSDDLAKRSIVYNLKDPETADTWSSKFSDGSLSEVKAGLYLFFLPVLFPSNIPASIKTLHGSLVHKLAFEMPFGNDKHSKKFTTRANYILPMVRAPPSLATSASDKPIHVNRVWNDALHYMITFPRKCVSLGSEHIINVKFIPLAKDVVLKRIKFNILEKTVYLSRDSETEYAYDGENNHIVKLGTGEKVKDRVISLCEIRTKQKSSNSTSNVPFKEEIIKCPNNNLLNACYESSNSAAGDDVIVASPMEIDVALPFLTRKGDKELLNGNRHDFRSFVSSRKSSLSSTNATYDNEVISSPGIGSLETRMKFPTSFNDTQDAKVEKIKLNSSNFAAGHEINKEEGSTCATKALLPDSNFKHIQVSHRLQISLRVSKPDPQDNLKVHHFEIVVDTPLILISSKCTEDSTQLPSYESASENYTSTPTAMEDREISFRIPQFSSNGVSFKNLDLQSPELLPSFDEAINTSPLKEEISYFPQTFVGAPLVSATSLKPVHLEPAPAYKGSQSLGFEMQSPRLSVSPISRTFDKTPKQRLSESSILTSPSSPLIMTGVSGVNLDTVARTSFDCFAASPDNKGPVLSALNALSAGI